MQLSSSLRLFLACGLALSIGWGIRGNFGHEYGAAFAGCLACFVGALLSGREDWRRRVFHFAFFGMIGWGFGGSISYMQVISYTHSSHAPSQFYGYVGLFWIGFLWAGLGVAGVAMAAAAERKFLDDLIVPILFVFAAWFLQTPIEMWIEKSLATAAAAGADATWHRHKSPLYWMDADYLPALFALVGVYVFDVWDRRGKAVGWLAVFLVGGAAVGWGVQVVLHAANLDASVANLFSFKLGDPNALDPDGKAFGSDNLLNNWPQWFSDIPQYIGVTLGVLAGAFVYFARFGAFRRGASLLAWMAAGWLCFFVAVPVLGSLFFQGIGGLRMTPPRSDDWAGITGVYLAMFVWFLRRGPKQVAWVSLAGAVIGGLGFSGIACLKQIMMSPGNKEKLTALAEQGVITPEAAQATIERWADWQSQNWHSFLEQSYGFVNGLAVAAALLLLLRRQPRHDDPADAPRWPIATMAFGVLLAITYVNIVKNIEDFTKGFKGVWIRTLEDGSTEPALWQVPYIGRLPGMNDIALAPLGWFNLSWMLVAVLFIGLVRVHGRRRLAIIPSTWLGKGQIAFLALMWVMIVANWERAIPGFHPSRLLTEWVVFFNGILVTWCVLVWPPESEVEIQPADEVYWIVMARLIRRFSIVVTITGIVIFFAITRMIYGDYFAGHSTRQMRFGEQATWRTYPILKQAPHR